MIIIGLAFSVTERIQYDNTYNNFTEMPAHNKFAINYTFTH